MAEYEFISYVKYLEIFEESFNQKFGNYKPQLEDTFGVLKKSRVIDHIWKNLRRLFDAYVQGRSLLATDQQLRRLISVIVEDKSESDFTFLLCNFLRTKELNIEF